MLWVPHSAGWVSGGPHTPPEQGRAFCGQGGRPPQQPGGQGMRWRGDWAGPAASTPWHGRGEAPPTASGAALRERHFNLGETHAPSYRLVHLPRTHAIFGIPKFPLETKWLLWSTTTSLWRAACCLSVPQLSAHPDPASCSVQGDAARKTGFLSNIESPGEGASLKEKIGPLPPRYGQ